MAVAVKRIYEKPARTDGNRVLVDRLWPRGVSKDAAALKVWLKELAPSDDLRHWFHARPEAWIAFRQKYLKELERPEASVPLQQLYEMAQERKPLTLLYASRNEQENNAVVLKDLLNGMKKPPRGTGPGAVRTLRQAKRMSR